MRKGRANVGAACNAVTLTFYPHGLKATARGSEEFLHIPSSGSKDEAGEYPSVGHDVKVIIRLNHFSVCIKDFGTVFVQLVQANSLWKRYKQMSFARRRETLKATSHC